MHRKVFKGLIVFAVNVAVALSGAAAFGQTGGDDSGAKPPLRMKSGQHIIMHDDEIVGALTPPETFTTADLRGWMFYPDGSYNLTEEPLLDYTLDMATNYAGVTAVATGRMHTTENDAVFVCMSRPDDFGKGHLAGFYEYDPVTGDRGGTWDWEGLDQYPIADPDTYRRTGRYIDCATGDFDGDGTDEVVMAYHGADNHPDLLVVKKADWTSSFGYDLGGYLHETGFTLAHDKSLAVCTGDFDGDGDDDVALAVEDHNLLIAVFVYEVDVEKGSISKKDALWVQDSRYKPYNRVDIAAGDLDGDGNDEIVATSSYHRIDVFDVDTDLQITLKHYDVNSDTDYIDNHIAAGDLDGDGDDEVVVGFQYWTTQNYFDKIGLDVYDFDNTLAKTKTYGEWVITDVRKTENYDPIGFDVATGNFNADLGSTDTGDIGVEVAVVYRTSKYIDHDNSHGAFRLQIYDATDGLGLSKKKEKTIVQNDIVLDNFYPCVTQKVVVAAGDFDGDSIAVGPPKHLVIEGHQDFSAVIQEPPKHIDYMKDKTLSGYTELNVTRDQNFYTEYQDEKKTEITTTDTSGTDYDWGVGVDVDVEKDFGIPKLGAIHTEISAGMSYDYNKHTENWNSRYESTTIGTRLDTTSDDYLVYLAKDIDVWRYPVIGQTQVETDDGKKGQLYVQITQPRTPPVKHFTDGSTVEWYQPVHENGNLLSYPWDKSQFENLGTIKTQPTSFTTGRNDLAHYVEWVNAGSDGVEVSTEKKLAVDSSVTVGGDILGADAEVTVKGHYDKTWSSINTSETTNSKSVGITIEKGAFDPDYVYSVSPWIYENKTMGMLEVAFAVDLLSADASSWWEANYSDDGLPDLALNLPHRWSSSDGSTWTFNKGAYNFQVMKGLFMLDSDGKPFGYSIKAGKAVTLKARVYNYSLVDADDVEVSFGAAVSADGKNWGAILSHVDTVSIPAIPGFQNASNEANWKYAEATFDTTGKAGNYYRFFVTVDPDDRIAEITGHDNGDKYANNQGYFGIPLFIEASDGAGATAEGDLFHEEVNLSDYTPKVGEWIMISDRISACDRDFRHVYVCFYDGDPDDGGALFDMELIPYIPADMSYTVQVPYNTYGKVGEREIFVTINGKIGEYDYENNTAVHLITIRPIPSTWQEEIVDLLRGS